MQEFFPALLIARAVGGDLQSADLTLTRCFTDVLNDALQRQLRNAVAKNLDLRDHQTRKHQILRSLRGKRQTFERNLHQASVDMQRRPIWMRKSDMRRRWQRQS